MAEVKLVSRYGFIRKDGRTGDDYVNSRWNDIFVTDVYEVDGALYAVHTELIDHYSFDIADDHGTWRKDVTFWVFPISRSNAASADRVAELVEQHKKDYIWKYAQDTLPSGEVCKTEEAFSEYIISQIPKALAHIQAVQREQLLRQQGEGKPNAVEVTCMGVPFQKTVYDFSDEGICRAIDQDVSSYNAHLAPGVAKRAGLKKQVCFIVRTHVKSGTIHNWPMSFLLDWSVDGNVILCGYEDGRPAPLTQAEVAAVEKAVAEFKHWYNHRPRH